MDFNASRREFAPLAAGSTIGTLNGKIGSSL
jgi:hypothetical protein